MVQIDLPGNTNEIRVNVHLNGQIPSTKDFLLEVQLFNNGLKIESQEIDIFYSQTLDINFAYFPDVDSDWLPIKSIKSNRAFNSVILNVRKVPWAKSEQTVEDLKIIDLKYAAKDVALDGNKNNFHMLGRV